MRSFERFAFAVLAVFCATCLHAPVKKNSASQTNQLAWHFNATGNDTNDCATAATACAHLSEIIRRNGLKWRIEHEIIDIWIESDLDDAEFSFSLGEGSLVVVHGSIPPLRTSSVSSFSRTWRTQEATLFGDDTIASWRPCDAVFMTGGAAVDAWFWAAKDLGEGVARTSFPETVDIYNSPANANRIAAIAAGDPYEVPHLPRLTGVTFDVDADVEYPKGVLVLDQLELPHLEPQPAFVIVSRSHLGFAVGVNATYTNDCVDGPFLQIGTSTAVGGLFTGFVDIQGSFEFNQDVLFQGTSPNVQGFAWVEDYAGFFDVASPINVWLGSRWYVRHGIYGTGISGPAVNVQAGGQFRWSNTVFAFHGQFADVALGGRTSIPPINPTTDLPADTAISLSFANLLAPYPGGFGGSAIDPVSGAAFLEAPDSQF